MAELINAAVLRASQDLAPHDAAAALALLGRLLRPYLRAREVGTRS
jgi:hypothetical protein